MSVAYTLYINEPTSRNLELRVDPEEVEWRRIEELHQIDYHLRTLVDDLGQLLPEGYTIQLAKELPE